MGKNISLFSGYNQKENRTTNYCLLILKMIYEENPKFLSDVVSTITNEDIGNLIGVKFSQQEKKKTSTPDGLITQRSFSIYIETKRFDWFNDSQLKEHLNALKKEKSDFKILLALGNFDTGYSKFESIERLCREENENSIFFRALSFEDFVQALQLDYLSKNLSDAIADFKTFLNEENLLYTWINYLDVINCADLPEEVLKEKVYVCPAEGGSYNHSRCKYFGMYRNKKVEKVALIEAVVDVNPDSAHVKWKNIDGHQDFFVNRAKEKIRKLRTGNYAKRIFLLGELYDTNFIKDSSGGVWGSKRYFDISMLKIKDAEELAEKLKDKTWNEPLPGLKAGVSGLLA